MGYVALGIALHYQGDLSNSLEAFETAEALHLKAKPEDRFLASIQGCDYCELLLDLATLDATPNGTNSLQRVRERVQSCIEKATAETNLLPLALSELAKARCEYGKPRRGNAAQSPDLVSRLSTVVARLRQISGLRFISRALLVLAEVKIDIGDTIGARADLDEALDIVLRGALKLQMADVYLHRAQLFFRETAYPWDSPETDLVAARKLIEECGYGRRREELEDVEEALRRHRAGK
jgi:hypothetical protein